MPAQYAPLPNPQSQLDGDEMEAAFEASDDEDESDVRTAESRPLNPLRNYGAHGEDAHDDDRDADTTALQQLGGGTFSGTHVTHARTRSVGPGSYDFESVDYDFPPPGSPPRRDRALPNNDWGNSNGVLPSTSVARPRPRAAQGFGWVRRVLPTRVTGGPVGRGERRGAVGGGGLDGVFANVTAKPTAPMQIREEDGIYVQPEDAQKDAPPSYASAQADAVPPYWETTIHAPSSLSPGMMIPGELPIEGLATGTLFSFMWNMLVSISFQFVGFLLTYLLHTTHAAKLGARAGLGLTLVQYGFALRTGRDGSNEDGGIDAGTSNGMVETFTEPIPSFSSGAEADAWFADHPNATMLLNPSAMAGGNVFSNDMTTEWLAFLLMTIGWFVLLNSLLGFWRIKRLERSILASHEEQPDRPAPIPLPVGGPGGGQGHGRQSSFAVHFERTLGLRLPTMRMLQSGLGLRSGGGGDGSGRVGTDAQLLYEYDGDFNRVRTGGRGQDLERGSFEEDAEAEVLLAIPEDHPERERLIAEALANERRLQQDLRAAGLL
ncbi:hypothetical protein M0805_006146 [Coniferiporia weirii]|nr:hypothetical protein M0805_006146 [Coniferiporia weirii]